MLQRNLWILAFFFTCAPLEVSAYQPDEMIIMDESGRVVATETADGGSESRSYDDGKIRVVTENADGDAVEHDVLQTGESATE